MPEATHSTSLILLLCAAIMFFGGILLTFIPRFPAVIPTYCGLWLLRLSGFAAISGPTMLWWGVASAIVTGLIYLLPREISGSRRGLPYIATGTLAGTAVGAIAATITSIIAGAVVGALLGTLAYSRTPDGRELAVTGNRFVNYALAKAMPAVINFTMTAIGALYIALIL